MKHLSGLKLVLLSALTVFVVSGGGLATVTAWQDSLTVGDATVTSGDGWGGHKFTRISAAAFHTVAIDTNGDAWAWGANGNGQLGNGATSSSKNTPVQVAGGHKFTQITVGNFYTVAIDTNGDAWAWGKNESGQFGDGTTTNKNPTPVKVTGGHKFVQISANMWHTVAIDTNGDAWAWGRNNHGQLGDGTTNNSPVPVKVTGGHRFAQISAGNSYTAAIDTNGDTWAWGWNGYGQLGDGTTNGKTTPVRVSGGHKFTQISAGDCHTVAIDTNRQAWAWGNNGYGQLGDGTLATNSPIPVKVLAR